jgi:hypothetical protein
VEGTDGTGEAQGEEMTIPFDRVIWNAQDCADYFKQSRQEFLRQTRHGTGFPKELPARPRHWRALEVTNWALTGQAHVPPQDYAGSTQKAA